MKKVLLLLTAILIIGALNAQVTYKATRAEWHLLNERTQQWEPQVINEDVNISIVAYKDVINIQAQRPSLYRISNKQNNRIGGFVGYRYDAFEYVDMKKCTVDLLKLEKDDSSIFIISIIVEEQGRYVNLRYFANMN